MIAIFIFVGSIVDFIFSTIRHVGIAKIIKNLNNIKNKAGEKKEEFIKAVKDLDVKNRIIKKLDKISLKYPSLRIRTKRYKIKGNIDDVKKELEDTINE